MRTSVPIPNGLTDGSRDLRLALRRGRSWRELRAGRSLSRRWGLLFCGRFVSLQGPEMTDEENHRLFRRVISASEPANQASARPRYSPAGAFRTGFAAGAFGPEFVWRWGLSPSQIPLSMTSRHRRSGSCPMVSGSIPVGCRLGRPMPGTALFLRVRPLRIARGREADRRPSGLSSMQFGYRRDCTVLSETGVRAVRGLLAVTQS